jgi:hypothetical protein
MGFKFHSRPLLRGDVVLKKFNIVILSLLIVIPGAAFSENSGSADSPLGEIEFISAARGEILVRSLNSSPGLVISPGNFVYVKTGSGVKINFTVKEISGIYVKCAIEGKNPGISATGEGMTVYDNSSINSRSKYYDAKAVLRKLIKLYEDFIIAVESTEKPLLIAEAVEHFSSNLEILIPDMAMVNKKYPELKNFDVNPPSELASESALLKKIEPRLKDVFYKIRGYMNDEHVKARMLKLQEVLGKMKRAE